MRLAYAILADAVEISANGKVSMLGGEVSEIASSSFPAFPVRLGLIAKLIIEPEECDKEYHFRLTITAPKDTLIHPPFEAAFTPQNTGEMPIRYLFVINVPLLVMPVPGLYQFRIAVDDKEFDALPLSLKEGPSLSPSEAEQ